MRLNSESRRGNVVVLVAVCLTVLMSIVAIALDGGLLLFNRRNVQAAADAAALAAAEDLFNNYVANKGLDLNGSAKACALSNAAANGYTNDITTSVVKVQLSPDPYLDGPNKGTTIPAGYAEVIIEFNQKRGFSGIFGSGDLLVRGRAVARGTWSAYKTGILVLDPLASGSLNGSGGGSITVYNAPVLVNSLDSSGGVLTNGSTLTAPQMDFSGTPGYTGTFNSPDIRSGQAPTPDPLAYLAQPDPNTMTIQSRKKLSYSSGSKPLSLQPGVYQGGISVTGGDVVMAPGIYYMQGGGFSFSGQGNLKGTEVMIYNAPESNSDVIKITGSPGVKIELTPPTTGLYQGITLFQERTANQDITLAGNGLMNVTGTFYAAGATLNVSGGSTGNYIGSQYISNQLKFSGNGQVTIDWNADKAAKIRLIGLVE